MTCEVQNETTNAFPGVIIPPEYVPNDNPLKPRIDSVSATGSVYIRFNRAVNKVENYTMIEEGEVLIEDEVFPVLKLKMLPGEYSNIERLEFDWVVVNSTHQGLTLQLIFKNSKEVSIWSQADGLEVTFYGYHIFQDTRAVSVKPNTQIRTLYIPSQIEEETHAWVTGASRAFVGVISASYLATFVINKLLGGSLNQLFSSIRNM